MNERQYNKELAEMDDPFDDDTNIDYVASAKLLTCSSNEAATWLAESITEQDSKALVSLLTGFLDGRDAVGAIQIADVLADLLCKYMRNTIQNDYMEYMGSEG